MDAALNSAFAALGGSFIGAMAPVLSNYVIQKSQTRRDLVTHQITQREMLYAEFISDASRLYAKSLVETLDEMSEMVALYALVSRLRLLSSDPVLRAAEHTIAQISHQFGQPNITITQIANSGILDPLGNFSSACRRELHDLFEWNSRLTGRRGGW